MNGEVFIPIVLFLIIFGMFYLYITARHKERMVLIETGADPNLFLRRKNGRRNLSWWVLKIASFLMGVAIGVLIGNVLEVTTALKPEVCYVASIFFFGGLGLLLYYVYEKRQLVNDEEFIDMDENN